MPQLTCRSLLLVVAASLTACGGGGGGGSTNAPPPPNAGAAPSITSQPADASVTSGQSASFTVTAAGTAPMTFQWRRNGVAIAGATTSSYATGATATTDNGVAYSVVVTNSVGSITSRDAMLTVTTPAAPPTITTHPAPVSLSLGQMATFSVVAGGTAPLAYQWRKNGVAIGGATAAQYTTPATVASDDGALFTVVVTNSAGSATSNAAQLSVITPIAVAKQSRLSVGNYAGSHTVGLKGDGTVWGWGNNQFGQLGLAPNGPIQSPLQLTIPSSKIVSIAASQHHTAIVDDQGRVYTAGFNHNGVLGTSTPVGSMQASFQAAAISDVVAVSAGNYANVCIKKDGSVWEFGYTPIATQPSTPHRVGSLAAAVSVTIGSEYRFASLADGSVWFWGADRTVAAGATSVNGQPAMVPTISAVARMISGGGHLLALKTDGTVWSWGWNSQNQLGYTTTTAFGSNPQQVPGLTDVIAVAAGWEYSLALRRDGTVWAWGDNSRGQLGFGATSLKELPRQIPGLSGVTDIAAGDLHAIFARSDGSVWVSGTENSLHQLGIPGVTKALVPTQIPGLSLR
jgi:alpha-tubulin suppressor-like RCC1 family protein